MLKSIHLLSKMYILYSKLLEYGDNFCNTTHVLYVENRIKLYAEGIIFAS
jgi:hypothetical protein